MILKYIRSKETTSQNIIDNVSEEVEVVAEETNYADAYSNLDEAFGPADAFQENFLNRPFRFLFGADPAGETGAAVRARNALNLEIKAILAADYTGKPSNLLLQEIEKILPTSTATSEKDAYEKYLNLLQRTKSRAKNLEQGIRSEITSDANKEKYRDELFKTRELEKKLDAAVLSLKPKDKEALEPPEDFGFDPGEDIQACIQMSKKYKELKDIENKQQIFDEIKSDGYRALQEGKIDAKTYYAKTREIGIELGLIDPRDYPGRLPGFAEGFLEVLGGVGGAIVGGVAGAQQGQLVLLQAQVRVQV